MCRLQRSLWILACGSFLSIGATSRAQQPDTLRSFYVKMPTEVGDEIVTVDPMDDGVRVRVIRVERAHDLCPAKLVQVRERIVPNTTVPKFARVPVCSISESRIESALKRAPDFRQHIDFLGRTDILVASCDGDEKVFVFREPPLVNHDQLRRHYPQVHALWDLGYRTRALLGIDKTGQGFDSGTEEARSEREALGTGVVPELISGKFDAAFADSCWDRQTQSHVPCQPNFLAYYLRGYDGPPKQRGPLPVDLVEREFLSLTKYVAPVLHPIAISARVFGDVRLRISVDHETGVPSDVQLISGPPLHPDAAIKAAREWRFAPSKEPRGPFEVTLRFEIRCAQN